MWPRTHIEKFVFIFPLKKKSGLSHLEAKKSSWAHCRAKWLDLVQLHFSGPGPAPPFCADLRATPLLFQPELHAMCYSASTHMQDKSKPECLIL